MKAILYARVSTKKQADEGFSLRQQLEALREYCEENDLEVVAEFEESFSGESLVRPALDDLLDLVEAGLVDVVLAQDADRITRDPYNRHQLEDELARYGTKLKALDDWGDDSHEGELLRYIRGWKAKGERLDIARRSRRGRRKKAKEGLVPGSGPAPYGFKYDREARTYVIDEEQMVWVRKIFATIADGSSISQTTQYLRKHAAPTPGGRLWYRSTVRDIILEDDVYAGVYTWSKQKITYEWVRDTENGQRRHKNVVKRELYPEEESIAIPVPDSGIGKEIIERARKRIQGNKWTPSSNGDLVWELSGGIAVCGECGYRLKTHSTSNSAKKKYYYHICPDRNTNQDNGTCSNTKHYPKEELESIVGQTLADTLQYDTWKEFVDKTINQKIKDLRDMHRLNPGQTIERLHQEIDTRNSSILRAKDLYVTGDYSRSEYDEKVVTLNEEKKKLEAQISKYEDLDGAMKDLEFQRHLLMSLAPAPDGEDNIYFEYDGTPADDARVVGAYVDNPTFFTNRSGKPTSQGRLDFYRRMDLHVKVGGSMEITLDLSGVPVSQHGETTCNTGG